MKELIKKKKFIIFGLILSIIGLFIIFAEYTAPYDPIEINQDQVIIQGKLLAVLRGI